MKTYELTAEVANGDWHWIRFNCNDFHEAVVEGLDFAASKQGRLVSVLFIEVHEQAVNRRVLSTYRA